MREELLQDANRLRSLADVLPWALKRGFMVANVVAQDEYSHDVLFRVADNCFLVFDTS